MKIFKQLLLVLAICIAGQALCLVLPFPFPGSVAAMLILLALLATRVLKPESIDTVADFLVGNLGFFFIPSAVGVLEYVGFLRGSILKLLVICLVTTVLTMLATAGTVTLVRRWEAKRRG